MYKLLSIVLAACFSLCAQAAEITFYGNQGVAIESKDAVIIIDAIYQHHTDWEGFQYDATMLNTTNLSSFAKKKIFLAATHVHRDHFHPELVGAALDTNANARLVAGQQVIESVKEGYINEHRFRDRLHCVGSKSCPDDYQSTAQLDINAFSTQHNHESYNWVENTSYIVTVEDKQVLHLGDSALTQQNITQIAFSVSAPEIAIIPYWFIQDPKLYQQFIHQVSPKKVLLTHVPKAFLQRMIKFTESLTGAKHIVPYGLDTITL